MEKILLLLLGIAINGENKERFIEQIQNNLDTHVQMELVPYIKLVNDDISFSMSKTLNLELIDFESSSVHKNDLASFKNIDDLNLFLADKLLPNLQRIIDERDSYLENIIELEQDKDYLNYKLHSSLDANGANQSTEQLDVDSNSNNLDSLKTPGDNKSSSLINLSDTQTLFMLFESIYKEKKCKFDNCNNKTESDLNSFHSIEKEEALRNHAKISLNSNWNQKIAIELVECKIKLKQLINEM